MSNASDLHVEALRALVQLCECSLDNTKRRVYVPPYTLLSETTRVARAAITNLTADDVESRRYAFEFMVKHIPRSRGGRGGQTNLPTVLAGLVLAVAAMWLVGWVGDHAAAGARLLARASTAVANLIESP